MLSNIFCRVKWILSKHKIKLFIVKLKIVPRLESALLDEISGVNVRSLPQYNIPSDNRLHNMEQNRKYPKPLLRTFSLRFFSVVKKPTIKIEKPPCRSTDYRKKRSTGNHLKKKNEWSEQDFFVKFTLTAIKRPQYGLSNKQGEIFGRKLDHKRK